MAQEEDVVAIEGEEDGGPKGPTHDPFTFKVLCFALQQQSTHGLRHNDHLRYRQYCARRLRRLYCCLRHKHGKGRYKPQSLPEDFQDVRWLEIPLTSSERAWSYGVQIKADNAAASSLNLRSRHHSISRFAKAVKWAEKLEVLCKIHGDQRTQLEAEAYSAFLSGTYLLEKEQWSDALAKFKRCKRLCDHLGLASDTSEAIYYKTLVQDISPMLRECRYNLGMGFDVGVDDDEDAISKGAIDGKAETNNSSGLKYRGRDLIIESDKIKGKLVKCVQSVADIDISIEEDSTKSIEMYGALSIEFTDVLREIHNDMISAGAEGQRADWRFLEAFTREQSISMNIERNLVLLCTLFKKFNSIEDITSLESQKLCRVDEGVRFCDLLKEDFATLESLPDAAIDSFGEQLSRFGEVVQNSRSLLLAICYIALGKNLEAASLLDMLSWRVEQIQLYESESNDTSPMVRFRPLFERVVEVLPAQVARWRCQCLAHLYQVSKDPSPETPVGRTLRPANKEFAAFADFPPKFSEVSCKPLLFDLAFPCIEAPDIESILPKKDATDDQKGILRRVAGGLGSRLGNFWGKK